MISLFLNSSIIFFSSFDFFLKQKTLFLILYFLTYSKPLAFELLERIKESIIKKPEKHYFNIENEKPTVKRFMSFTGG